MRESLIGISDIGILCTYSEGISNSVKEYMARGSQSSPQTYTGAAGTYFAWRNGFCIERSLPALREHINILLTKKTYGC
jgi:hypothetical protein